MAVQFLFISNSRKTNSFLVNIQTLRKHALAIYRDFLSFKIENFPLKNFDIFLIFAQNIDCRYTLEPPCRGGSNEYPQSMFWSKNKKKWYTPAYPSFAIIKWGSGGYTFHRHVFLMFFNVLNLYQCLLLFRKQFGLLRVQTDQ